MPLGFLDLPHVLGRHGLDKFVSFLNAVWASSFLARGYVFD